MSFVEHQVTRLHEKASGTTAQRTNRVRGLVVLAVLVSLIGGTSLFVYATAVQLNETWADVGVGKRFEVCALMALVSGVALVVVWHICTSQEAGDLIGEVLPGAQHISSTLQSGRIFFFRRYWFKLQAPEVKGKSFRLDFHLTQFAEECTEVIYLTPGRFKCKDAKQARPGRPHTFRLDGEDSDTGREFKYVFATRTAKELRAWQKVLTDLSKADPATVKSTQNVKIESENGVTDPFFFDGWMELEATAKKAAGDGVERFRVGVNAKVADTQATVGAVEDESCTLWVGSIPESHVAEDCIYDLLSEFGDILSVTLRVKPSDEYEGDAKRSWAFVTFDDTESVTKAISTGVHVFGKSSMLQSSGASGHPLRLRRANVASELKKKSGRGAEGALGGIADEHKLGKVGIHSYAQSMIDAVLVLPTVWIVVWSIGAVAIVVVV